WLQFLRKGSRTAPRVSRIERNEPSDPEMLDADRTPKVTKLLKMQQINLPSANANCRMGIQPQRIDIGIVTFMMRRILRVLLLTTALGCLPQLLAGDLRITLPKHSNPTPVQALNQQGVNEVRKHHLEKAEKLFYRAYLIDPDDPFTLNNLGYISVLPWKPKAILRKPFSTTARPRTCTPRKKLLWRSTAAGGVNPSVTWLRGTQKQSATGWRRRRAPRTKSRG